FFQSKSHTIVPSAPMVIKDDPSLMFTNAGMNQFKEYFLGNGMPENPRLTDTQKCLRVSGKHNDLEEVGKDTYHHTMFEMLGNWSIGDYFKEEAISWAWELLTEVYKINKDVLYVTYFEGNDAEGIPMDSQARDLWKGIIPEQRIIPGNKKDNFWEMGDQGPCGPSSEIHVDIRSEEEKARVPGRDLINMDHPQVVEIWNLVFIEYNRKAGGELIRLPAQHVDTGMGFERLCMVLQGVKSNYDTDVFTPLIKEIETITGFPYGKNEKTDIAIRVIADHLRAVAFAIADGQLPSNTGAGYVIRRILRRAIRYGFTFLGQKEAFIYKLIKPLCSEMGEAFPELRSQKELIENVIREEENSFLRTLAQGLVLLDQVMESAEGKMISGKKAFELYDTFGFPIDLTALILSENGFTLDNAEFEKELEKQKTRSRNASKTTSGDWMEVSKSENHGFVGYDKLETSVELLKFREVENRKEGKLFQLVFNRTPFYPEGGGQVGDRGFLEGPDGDRTEVIDTKKENNQIIHITKKLPSDLYSPFKAMVNREERAMTAANHSATHLLHQALRKVLGTHVEQKGSLVNRDYLRFDFSHFAKMTPEETVKVEDLVNEKIREHIELLDHRAIPYPEAMEMGAMALFGEKYGDVVRMVVFDDSAELCGGTHVQNTSDIWYFKIISESAVAAGVRRIEAITGRAAQEFFTAQTEELKEVKTVVKNKKDPVRAILMLQDENAQLKKQVEALQREKGKNLLSELKNEIKERSGVQYLIKEIELDAGGIKDLSFRLGEQEDNLFLVFATRQNGKALLSCYISKELVEKKGLHAGKVVKELGQYIKGGGGGQAFYATAGGKNPDGIPQALDKAKELI
ncbi:MAG TPA: alanine--tRNA ligase, partial [Salinimicrobium sp.]|nr:alanine--tRNA ligase [Salinimicrobium sp.]